MRPAALLLHGLASSPRLLDGLCGALEGAGFDTACPLLPGHGSSLDALERSRWSDYVAAAAGAFEGLSAPGRPVVVVGHSTGGALAARLAADGHDVAGLVAINPFVDPPAASFRDILRLVREQGHRSVPVQWRDAADPEAVHEGALPEIPVATLLSVCEGLDALVGDLPSVTCPALVLTSRVDHVVPPESSDVLAEMVGGRVERVWLERSHHLAPIDHDRAEVVDRTLAFASVVTRDAGRGAARTMRP